jgi:hypothetical protein
MSGKGSLRRPSQIPPDVERANWSMAFNQCYTCSKTNLSEPQPYVLTLNNGIEIHTKQCVECARKEKEV